MVGLVDKVFRQLQLITRLVHLLIYMFFATFAFVIHFLSQFFFFYNGCFCSKNPFLIIICFIIKKFLDCFYASTLV